MNMNSYPELGKSLRLVGIVGLFIGAALTVFLIAFPTPILGDLYVIGSIVITVFCALLALRYRSYK